MGGGEQGPWPGPMLTQRQFLPFLMGFPACFPCLPGFGPARRKELVPRVHTLLLLGAFCLGCLSVRVWRSLSTADLPVLPGRFPQRLTQWAHVGVSPARPPPASSCHTLPGRCPSAPRSLLTHLPHSAQPHPLGNRPSCPPPLVEFKSFLSGDSCHRLRSSLSPPAPFCASRWEVLLGSVTSLSRNLGCEPQIQCKILY